LVEKQVVTDFVIKKLRVNKVKARTNTYYSQCSIDISTEK